MVVFWPFFCGDRWIIPNFLDLTFYTQPVVPEVSVKWAYKLKHPPVILQVFNKGCRKLLYIQVWSKARENDRSLLSKESRPRKRDFRFWPRERYFSRGLWPSFLVLCSLNRTESLVTQVNKIPEMWPLKWRATEHYLLCSFKVCRWNPSQSNAALRTPA